MNLHPLAGVYVAAVTPLGGDDQLQLDALPDLLAFYAEQGVHGVLFFGTTGEGPSFSPTEREALWKEAAAIRDADFPALRLLAGTGTPSLDESVYLTRAAFSCGFDGVVVLPPYYFRQATDEGLFRWFAALIKDAVPTDGFLLGYHIPKVSGVGFSLPLLARLKEAFPRRFAGIKDSSHQEDFALQLGKTFGADLLVLNGTDSLLATAWQEGLAQGAITAPANLMGAALRHLWDAWQAGESLDDLQGRITAVRECLEDLPPFPPTLKGLLATEFGLPRWALRPPLLPVAAEDLQALRARLRPLLAALP